MRRYLQYLSILTGVLLLSLVSAMQVFAAGTPQVYFGQTSLNVGVNTNTTIPIRINANGTAINTVNVVVSFPTSSLSFESFDRANGYFDTAIPSTPTETSGRVEFSVASLAAGSTSSDVLIGNLILKAKTNTGSAQVSLNSSVAANNGTAIPVNAGTATVNFSDTVTPPTALTINDIMVSDITVSSGVVRWKTNIPASSSVTYGATDQYGSTAGSNDLTTDHSVQLGSLFSGKTLVHFKVTSVAADGSSQTSGDQTFTTLGYTVQVTVKDTAGKPVTGAAVKISGSNAAVRTNDNGVATIPDVAPGTQKFIVDNGQPQLVTVNTPTKGDTKPQEVTLTANRQIFTLKLVGITTVVLTIVAAIAFFFVLRGRGLFPI